MAVAKDLDNLLVLSEQVAVENLMFRNPRGFAATWLDHLTGNIQALCLVATALLRRTKLEEWDRLDQTTQEGESALRAVVAEQLQTFATQLEQGRSTTPMTLESARKQWVQTIGSITGNDRPRLVRRLVRQVERLA